jgi:hypothetical protein
MGVSHDERTGSALRQSPDDLRTRVTSDGQRLRSSGNKPNASRAHGIPIWQQCCDDRDYLAGGLEG